MILKGCNRYAILADQEAAHAALLAKRRENPSANLPKSDHSDFRSVFSGLADFRSEIKVTPDQLDVYRLALEKERESIALYERMLSENPEDANLFEYLIRQETEHAILLEEIVKIVERPHSWVEAAEFGIREEY